eukprot:SAG31_NODE_913_length_11064_cov_4.529594_3_plen_610_part_00
MPRRVKAKSVKAKSGTGFSYAQAAVVSVVAVSISVFFLSSCDDQALLSKQEYDDFHRLGPASYPAAETKMQVKVVDWAALRNTLPQGTTLSAYLMDLNIPVKLINSGAEAWPASKWTPLYFFNVIENMGPGAQLTMQESLQPGNMYYDQPTAQQLEKDGITVKAKFEKRQYPMTQVHNLFRAANDKRMHPTKYFYFNGPLDHPKLMAGVPLPTNTLEYTVFDNSSAAQPCFESCGEGCVKLCDDEVTMNLWMGSAGLTAHMHYDTFHNTHTCVYGAKHFMIAPPADFDKAYLYPAVYPGFRQTAITNMTHLDLEHFPNASDLAVQETIIRPGETLYVPPYWLHAVEHISTTMSVGITTVSSMYRMTSEACARSANIFQYAECQKLFSPLLRILNSHSRTSKRDKKHAIGAAMRLYLVGLLRAVAKHFASTSPGEMAGTAQWLRTSFSMVYETAEMETLGLCEQKAVCAETEDNSVDVKEAVQTIVREQLGRFRAIFNHSLPVGRRSLFVHVEGVASSHIFNSYAKTCSWLRDCVLPELESISADKARAEERREALRTELTPLSVRELRQRAVTVNVDSALLEDARDSDNPKGAILELIVEKEIDVSAEG